MIALTHRTRRLALVVGTALAACFNGSAHAQVSALAADLQICQAASSPFNASQSTADANGDYWVSYSCKTNCADWRQCRSTASAGGGGAKDGLAFVVDGMGGHFSFTTEQTGAKTVLLHTGVGGTNFMHPLSRQIESASDAKVVMVRWEGGFSNWGWFTRTSAAATRVPNVTRRIASVLAWVHENLAGAEEFGTVGCSMGTQATLGAVYWHSGVDSIVDYQLMVGGPGLWDINAGCGRRQHTSGFCDLDASRTCSADADCASLSARSRCTMPGPIPLASLYESVVNHVHATQACDVSAADSTTPIHADFDESGFGYTTGDWDFDHPIDFQMDLWGSDGDHRWAMGDAMHVFNSITSASGHPKRWNTTPDSNHCAAIGDGRALELVVAGMALGQSSEPTTRTPRRPPPPPPPVNRAPTAAESFADIQIASGEELTVALDGKFRDDGALRYAAESSAPSVASVRIVGNSLRVRGRSPGQASITVTASDNAGLSAEQRFDAEVGWLLSFESSTAYAREGGEVRLRLALNRPAATALVFAWRAVPDEDSASADAEDIAVAEGSVAFAVGDTKAFIDLRVLDDEDIEPAREWLRVELLPPPETDAAFFGQPLRMAIQEGVCDRSPQVRDALRGRVACWRVTPTQLARRTELDLSAQGIETLRAEDLSGLSQLRVLRLQENQLTALPPGLFADIPTLAELNLLDNPGTPFALTISLARVDAAEPWAPGPAQVAPRVLEGAPFPMRAGIQAVGAELSAQTVSVPAGQMAGPSIRVSATGEAAAQLSFSAPPAVPATMCGSGSARRPCFQGLVAEAGPPLVLFKLPPGVAVAEPPTVPLVGLADQVRVRLAPLFIARGESLTFAASSDSPGLVAASVEGETLVLDANADGEDGVAVITVTATDWAGQSATVTFHALAEYVPRGFWRNWRLNIPDSL